MSEILWQEITAGLPDGGYAVRVVFRLLAALVLAAIVGAERERTGKSAGLRTHMLVSLSSAVFVLSALEMGMEIGDLSRVIQGVATGIGFLGAGAILKMQEREHIKGLTTAAGIWMTAAVGVAAGMGRLGLAALAVLLGWVVLAVLARFERHDRPWSD